MSDSITKLYLGHIISRKHILEEIAMDFIED